MQSENHLYAENLPVISTGFVSDQLKRQGAQIFLYFLYCNKQWTILRGEQLRLEQVLFQANKKNNNVHRQKPWPVSMELQCKGGILRESGQKFSAKKCSYFKSTVCIHSSINHILRLYSSSLFFFISNFFFFKHLIDSFWRVLLSTCRYSSNRLLYLWHVIVQYASAAAIVSFNCDFDPHCCDAQTKATFRTVTNNLNIDKKAKMQKKAEERNIYTLTVHEMNFVSAVISNRMSNSVV